MDRILLKHTDALTSQPQRYYRIIRTLTDERVVNTDIWHPTEAEIQRLSDAISHPGFDKRAKTFLLRLLGVERAPGAVDFLIGALRDEDANVRREVAAALGSIENPQAVEPLIATLRDPHGTVRQAAAEALGLIKNPQAVEPLIATLQDPHGTVRQAAAEALGSIKSTQAVEPLIATLQDPHGTVRQAAAEARFDQERRRLKP